MATIPIAISRDRATVMVKKAAHGAIAATEPRGLRDALSLLMNRERHIMAATVYKKIELVGTSSNSFSEATANAVAKAAETVRNMSWFEVLEQRGNIADGKVQQYQVTISVGFRVD